jgi:hypothetical protein
MLSWIRSKNGSGRRSGGCGRAGNGSRTFRPELEPLEVRLVPSLVPVSSPNNVHTGFLGGQVLTEPPPVAFQAGRTAAVSAPFCTR